MKATRGGEEGLRAVRLADQVLRSLESHRWDGAGTPAPAPLPSESGSVLQAHACALKSLKPSSNLDSLRGGLPLVVGRLSQGCGQRAGREVGQAFQPDSVRSDPVRSASGWKA